MSTAIWLVNLAVLIAVLGADLGTRQITRRRILRPLIVSAVAVAGFVKSPQSSGTGLALELAGLSVGLALGALGSHRLMTVRRDESAGTAASIAGAGYAALWTGVIGARLVFSYGADHWYSAALGRWLAAHQVTVAGLTDALVLLAIGMVLARVMRFARVLGSVGRPDPHAALRAVSTRS
jgi:hypothetical protein